MFNYSKNIIVLWLGCAPIQYTSTWRENSVAHDVHSAECVLIGQVEGLIYQLLKRLNSYCKILNNTTLENEVQSYIKNG